MAEKKKIPLLCAFNRRFDPSFVQVKERVNDGEVGEVHVIKTCSRDSPLPSLEYLKTSGGIFHDCIVHDIDVICWILKDRPISVSSHAHSFMKEIKELDDHDTVAVTLKFPSGAIGIIDVSRHSKYGYDQRLEVYGMNGMISSGDFRPTAVSSHNKSGSTFVPIYYSFASRYSDAYYRELDHFIKCVKG